MTERIEAARESLLGAIEQVELAGRVYATSPSRQESLLDAPIVLRWQEAADAVTRFETAIRAEYAPLVAAARQVGDEYVQSAGGDRWWAAIEALRAALESVAVDGEIEGAGNRG